jgi:type II secretory pathway pseudopilin PulG
MERLPRGPKGEQGEQGERGERGLPWRAARAIVVLFVISAGLAVFATFWVNHAVQGSAAAQAAQQQREQAAQERQSALLEGKLCTTLSRLASLMPPPTAPSDLSRVYLLEQHLVLAELGPDVGCPS